MVRCWGVISIFSLRASNSVPISAVGERNVRAGTTGIAIDATTSTAYQRGKQLELPPAVLGARWQRRNSRDSGACICQRFIEGRAGNRLLRGAAKVIDRLGGIVATTVMMSEFGQMVVERTCIKRFERRADALVQLLAPLYQDRSPPQARASSWPQQR
jgi:hypothetical protein